jgi:hypothetical protein
MSDPGADEVLTAETPNMRRAGTDVIAAWDQYPISR